MFCSRIALLLGVTLLLMGIVATTGSDTGATATATTANDQSLEGKSVTELLELSKRHLAAGQRSEALAALDVAVQRDPTDYLTVFRRAGKP